MSLNESPIEELLAEGNVIRNRVIEKVGSEDGKWLVPGITKIDEQFALCLVLQKAEVSNIRKVRSAIQQVLKERVTERETDNREERPVKIVEVGKINAF